MPMFLIWIGHPTIRTGIVPEWGVGKGKRDGDNVIIKMRRQISENTGESRKTINVI